VVFTAISVVVGLPLAAAKYRLLVRFGVSEQKWPDWVKTTAKATLLGLIIFGLFLACLYTGIAVAPDWWWLWALAGMVGMSTAVSLVFPRWLLPLLTKATPLEDGELRERLLALAQQNGVNVNQVYVTDTSRKTKGLGAAVAGYGPARRILIADNLLNNAAAEAAPAASDATVEAKLADTTVRGATDDQIAVVVAHELAHARYQDPISGQLIAMVKLGLVLCSIYLFSGWGWLLGLPGVESITDPEALGLLLLMLSLGTQWLSPVTAWMSRRKEAYADWCALTVTGDPISLEQFWRKVVQTNLVDPSPRRSELLLASHPPVVDRIALTKAYGRNRSGSGEVAGALAPSSGVAGQVPA
jgi:STE24 endopeptidase